jgi:hypothetical protein
MRGCGAELIFLIIVCRVQAQVPVLARDLNLTAFEGRVHACSVPFVAYADMCTCDAGWTWQSEGCVPCAAGYFKQEPGSHACTACKATTTSFEGASEAEDCMCVAGYEPMSGVCQACAAGSYKSFVGNNSCVACPPNSMTQKVAADSHDACLCNVGYAVSADGPESCTACTQNTYTSIPGSLSCLTCPAHSETDGPASSFGDCKCVAGYTQGEHMQSFCVACPATTYKADRSMSQCTPCPKNMSAPVASTALANCTCLAGLQKSSPTTCEVCTENWYCAGADVKNACPGNSTSPRGSAGLQACTCLPGFFWYYGTCEQCSEDHFCANNERIRCPRNSSAPMSSASIDNCTCLPGFH